MINRIYELTATQDSSVQRNTQNKLTDRPRAGFRGGPGGMVPDPTKIIFLVCSIFFLNNRLKPSINRKRVSAESVEIVDTLGTFM